MTSIPIVALMCGSFNPVTRMHLQMMKIFKQFVLDNQDQLNGGSVVQGIISPVNDLYHVKRKNLLPSSHRINMVNLALIENKLDDWIECNSWESEQKEWQKTLQVLDYHQRRMKDKYGPLTQLWMVSGGDLIESMAVPGLWADSDLEKISSFYKLFIIPRIGSDAGKFIASHQILSRYSSNIIIANNVIPNDDSSTKARAEIRLGNYPTNLLNSSVIDYIKKHNIYLDN